MFTPFGRTTNSRENIPVSSDCLLDLSTGRRAALTRVDTPSTTLWSRALHVSPESNSYLCPAGEQLNYGGHSARNRTHVHIGTRNIAAAVRKKAQCTTSPLQYLAIPIHEPARQTRSQLSQYTCLGRGGSIVRRTQESDRTASTAPAEIKICSRAVLPGGDCAKYKKARSLPQPAKATVIGNHLVSGSQKLPSHRYRYPENFRFHSALFQHPQARLQQLLPVCP